MKISGKGIVIILVFLVAIPGIADTILLMVLPGKSELHLAVTGFLVPRYLIGLPVYIIYLVIAFRIIDWYKRYKQRSTS